MAVAAALTSVPALAAQPERAGHETVTHGMAMRNAHASKGASRPTRSSNLTYHGGATGLAGKVVIVYWGSQWDPGLTGSITNDPKGEAPLQLDFFNNITGSAWDDSTGQYCIGTSTSTVGASVGATSCNGPKQSYSGSLVARTWLDNTVTAPSRPTQSDLAAEAVRAATQLGTGNSVQYVIDTATGNNASGFGTQYCAWHSSTPYNGGQLAYTNMPYVSDAGASCGAGFVGVGSSGVDPATEGVTIVGGHEWAETVTDDYPNGGWLDGSGSENGDKCAWITAGNSGASHIVTVPGTTKSFAVQTLWSNAANGCVG